MLVAIAVAAIALIAPAAANASQLVDRDAKTATLQVNSKGEAMITFTAAGKAKHVLAWGALNANPPSRARKQVAFKLDYSGGYGKYRKLNYWNSFGGGCTAYDGPPLAWKVSACKAPDGSYWALQSWQRALPDYGLPAKGAQAAWELRLSHWTGELPVLEIVTNWAYRKYDHIFGTFTYGDTGVFGYRSTPAGVPLDRDWRNIYLDTFSSDYGAGWKRDNSFLTHQPKGSFCYGFFPHGAHPAGKGVKYRATAEGPGVTPDVMWQGDAPGDYDKAADAVANDQLRTLADPACKPN